MTACRCTVHADALHHLWADRHLPRPADRLAALAEPGSGTRDHGRLRHDPLGAVRHGAQLPEGLAHVPAWATLFSNILLHANVAHLVENMLFLWVFGDNVEDAMGHARFLAFFFFLCGLGGSLFHAGIYPDSQQPLIGASEERHFRRHRLYLMIYPQVRIWGLAFNWIPIHIPALYALGGWILLQAAAAIFGADGNVGWWAHLSGLATGAALTRSSCIAALPCSGASPPVAEAALFCPRVRAWTGVDKRKRASLRSQRIPAEGRDAAVLLSGTARREAHLF